MDHIGIDMHKRKSQIYTLAEGGEVVEQRIRTEAFCRRARAAAPRPSCDRGLDQQRMAKAVPVTRTVKV